ncbi:MULTISPECIES: hypothetical protein [Flavobacteriaceae]|uniref:hypothetical protein n=1 Tax=Flavobacteriaceae TaxID=49546 RepID=UPI00234B3881|nr:hypothetical protein [Muricauda sp. SP22]MDC6363078.1 hypothetical protein [Muricauda sp. SP22]
MENNDSLYFAVGGLFYGLIQLIVLIACIILVLKQRNTATILMLTGQILSIVFSLGGYLWNFLAAKNGVDSLLQANKIMSVVGPLPYGLFAIGLILFAMNQVKKKRLGQENV